MRDALREFGRIAAGFCAAFLVYVVIGTLVGFTLAEPRELTLGGVREDPTCWPNRTVEFVGVECRDPIAEAAWYGAVTLPFTFVGAPAWTIAWQKPPKHPEAALWLRAFVGYHFIYALYAKAALTVVMGLVGFAAWRSRRPRFAWLLLMTFAGEVVYETYRLWVTWAI